MPAVRLWQRVQYRAPVFSDGAMGSELIRQGMAPEAVLSANITRPAIVRGIHSRYIAAGANLITTNTFGRPSGQEWEREFRRGVDIAIRAATESVDETGVWLSLSCETVIEKADRLRAMAREHAEWPELLLIETCISLDEARQAVHSAAGLHSKVLAITAHFGPDHRLPDGTTPETFASAMLRSGAHMVGANCGEKPEDFIEIAARMRGATHAPLLIQPSAGIPERDTAGLWRYPVDPRRFAEACHQLAEAGTNIIGGCCGISYEHIGTARSCVSPR